jgi:transcriptional regulator with XRE-family HTH domain
MDSLSINLRSYRQEKGMSLRQLATRASVHHSYLSRIESGLQRADRISYGLLKGIAKALDVSVDELTGETTF